MAKWNYTIAWGTELRDAINGEDIQLVVKYLIRCYKELLNKLSDEDREWKEFDIEDAIDALTYFGYTDDEDDIDCYLDEFYDLCDDLRAWIEV